MKRRLPIGPVCILLPILLGCTAMPSIDAPTTDAPKDAVLSVVTVAPTNAVTFTPVPTPTPSPAPTDAPTSEPDGLIGWTVGGFCPLEETAVTDTSYTSDKVHLTVQTITDTETFSSKVTYFVIDLYIRDLSVLRTQAAKGFDRHTNGDFLDLCSDANALFAITGDYYGHHNHSFVVRNGTVYDTVSYSSWDVCVLYLDGSVELFANASLDINAVLDKGVWQIWQFGPILLDAEGKAITSFPKYNINPNNPRTVFGYYEPGHYCFVTIDGRQSGYSMGTTLKETAQLMERLGCTAAFNLDGGESAQLYWNGGVFNSPYDGGRELSDIIYIAAGA